jgi:nicotinamidase-related amidase
MTTSPSPTSPSWRTSVHWCSSDFANTDLDLQLKKHGIHQLIVIGLIAHTCIEATVRYAAELGYDVTVVRDAVADYTDEMIYAALDINMPNYARVKPLKRQSRRKWSPIQCIQRSRT